MSVHFRPLRALIALAVIAVVGMPARAAVVTSLQDGRDLVMSKLGASAASSGTQDFGSEAVWTSAVGNYFGYDGAVFLRDQGAWEYGAFTMMSNVPKGGAMTVTFRDTVMGVGAYMSYFNPTGASGARMSTFDVNHQLIDTYSLDFAHSQDPNSGEFHGFRDSKADIKSVVFSGGYINATNFKILGGSNTSPVPEPGTLSMMLAGLGALGAISGRRRRL